MADMPPELATKVASCLRTHRATVAELLEANAKLAEAKKDRDALKQKLDSYEALLSGVAEGSIDPDDCEEKLAELMDGTVKQASVEPEVNAVSIGRASGDDLDLETVSANPLEEFLLRDK